MGKLLLVVLVAVAFLPELLLEAAFELLLWLLGRLLKPWTIPLFWAAAITSLLSLPWSLAAQSSAARTAGMLAFVALTPMAAIATLVLRARLRPRKKGRRSSPGRRRRSA
jgi:hypothetical protein